MKWLLLLMFIGSPDYGTVVVSDKFDTEGDCVTAFKDLKFDKPEDKKLIGMCVQGRFLEPSPSQFE